MAAWTHHFAHDAGADALSGHVPYVGEVAVLHEHNQHHTDQPDQPHTPVRGSRVQVVQHYRPVVEEVTLSHTVTLQVTIHSKTQIRGWWG